MVEGRGVYRALLVKPERKRSLERPRRGREDHNKIDFRKWDVGVWTGLSCLRIRTVGQYL
jgi:hypothetical protein